MLFLRIARAGQEIIQSVKASLTRRHSCQTGSFQSVIEEFAADEGGTRGGAIVLQLVEETSFGSGLSGVGLGGSQGVENESSEGKLSGKRCGGEGEEGGEKMRSDGGLAGARFSAVAQMSATRRQCLLQRCQTYKKTTA